MSIRILLVDDHTVFRDCLKKAFEAELGFIVEGEASDGRAAVRLAREHEPNVVAMDIHMPKLNGIEATRQIISEQNETRVLALSMSQEFRSVQQMLRAGAAGYLTKRCPVGELFEAIRAVANGNTYLCQDVAGLVLADYRKGDGNGGGSHRHGNGSNGHSNGGDLPAEHLSSREREVLQLIAEGLATKQIALYLSVSAKTVESHRARLMNKLDIHNVADLTKFAIREGLTTFEV